MSDTCAGCRQLTLSGLTQATALSQTYRGASGPARAPSHHHQASPVPTHPVRSDTAQSQAVPAIAQELLQGLKAVAIRNQRLLGVSQAPRGFSGAPGRAAHRGPTHQRGPAPTIVLTGRQGPIRQPLDQFTTAEPGTVITWHRQW